MAAGSWFLAVYSVLLVGLASGLHWLGRRTITAWSAESAVVGSHDDGSDPSQIDPGWAHNESSRLHTVIGLVAAVAAIVLPLAGMIIYRTAAERTLLAVVAAIGALTFVMIMRAMNRHRAGRGYPDPDSPAHLT